MVLVKARLLCGVHLLVLVRVPRSRVNCLLMALCGSLLASGLNAECSSDMHSTVPRCNSNCRMFALHIGCSCLSLCTILVIVRSFSLRLYYIS